MGVQDLAEGCCDKTWESRYRGANMNIATYLGTRSSRYVTKTVARVGLCTGTGKLTSPATEGILA